MPHQGAGDAWRAHQAFQRVGVLCREAKGLESLGVGIGGNPGTARCDTGKVVTRPVHYRQRRLKACQPIYSDRRLFIVSWFSASQLPEGW